MIRDTVMTAEELNYSESIASELELTRQQVDSTVKGWVEFGISGVDEGITPIYRIRTRVSTIEFKSWDELCQWLSLVSASAFTAVFPNAEKPTVNYSSPPAARIRPSPLSPPPAPHRPVRPLVLSQWE